MERCYFFFFKQKTAYEIDCDWSSDVCSSDLLLERRLDDLGISLVVVLHAPHPSLWPLFQRVGKAQAGMPTPFPAYPALLASTMAKAWGLYGWIMGPDQWARHWAR